MTTTEEPRRTRRRAWDLALTVSFLAALGAPAVDEVLRTDVDRGPGPEMRLPAPRPSRPQTLKEVTDFPARYDAYYRDSFGLRDVLLGWNSLVKHYGFRVGASPLLVPDGIDWIDFDGDMTLNVWRGLAPLREEELEAWRVRLEEREARLAALGIRYLFVVIPNKETIYPERIPARFNRVGSTRLDQLVDWLEAHSSARFLDLRVPFLAEKRSDGPDDFLYNPLGTHWGARGALCAYTAVVERIRTWFPETHVLSREAGELDVIEAKPNHDNWARSLYIPGVLVQREAMMKLRRGLRVEPTSTLQPPPVRRFTYANPAAHGPRLLVHHDSFMGAIEHLLAATFSELEVVSGKDLDFGAIQSSRPDVVLEMFVERTFVYTHPPPSPYLRQARERKALVAEYPVVLLPSEPARIADAFEDGRADLGNGHDATSVWLDLPSPARVHVAIELECAADALLDVYWRDAEDQEFLRSRRVTIPVAAGSRTAQGDSFFVPTSRCQIRARIRDTNLSGTIRSLEVRASAR